MVGSKEIYLVAQKVRKMAELMAKLKADSMAKPKAALTAMRMVE